MTAVIGIKTNKGLESIVIGSDTQLSDKSEEDSEILDSKKTIRKIIHGGNWVMAFAGTVDEELYRFYKKLSGLKRHGSSDELVNSMILNAVKNYDEWRKNPKKSEAVHFREVVDLNARIMRKKSFDITDTVEFVLGVYLEDSGVRLFHVDEFGNLKEPNEEREFDYISIGSSSDRVKKYIKDVIEDDESGQVFIDTKRAIEIYRESMHKASREINTGGMDFTVLTSKGVINYGLEIKEALRKAEDEIFKEIGSRYDSHEVD